MKFPSLFFLFSKLSWLFLNIHTSIWILEPACQIPLKSWSGFDWDCVEFTDLLRGLRGSKNINSWHCDMASRKCVHSQTGSLDHWRQLWPWGPGASCVARVTQGHRGPLQGVLWGPSWDPESWCGTPFTSSNAHWAPAGGIWGLGVEGDQGTSNKPPACGAGNGAKSS